MARDEGMSKLLDALIIDKSQITDALIDRRQKSATRPGAMETARRNSSKTPAPPAKIPPWRCNSICGSPCRHSPSKSRQSSSGATPIPLRYRKPAKPSRRRCPQIKFHWIAGAGHQVQTDKPKKSAEIIRSFALN